MKLFLSFCFTLLLTHIGLSQETSLSDATLPLAEEDRAKATILAYDANGTTYLAKRGTNNYICLADDGNKDGFSVACYHKDLDTFMARGRELKAQGKGFKEIFDMREKEVVAGTLDLPKTPHTLYVMSGKTKAEANVRWVVYIPFATSESTGLPLKPLVPGGPWIMDPGTHRAHIMISPPGK